ncbi:LacI family DNA-binding transcriptional regulator [Enterococcus sp.]|uniref:LacI family DNA-binding transcriptional regulator n=1 Tax=Enterococcus sp. TaxID=35783 RepID=UPI002FC9B587
MSIRKIAKLAEVSTSTVSRVINQHPYVSEEIRQRVLDVMTTINYVPNRNAINLSNGQSNIIGVIVPYIRDSCYDQLIEGILEEATKQNKKVMLLLTFFNKDLEKNYYTLLRDKTLDGIIITSRTQDNQFLLELNQFGPIVVTEKTSIEHIPTVYPDRSGVYHKVFEFIQTLDVNAQIFITVHRNKEESSSTKLKTTLFSEYFPNKTIQDVFQSGISTYDDGYRLGIELFRNSSTPLIVYCNNEQVAGGFYKAGEEAGFVLNKDFYLIDENNQLLSQVLSISSLEFHLQKIGKQAVQHLITKATGHVKIDCDFIVRG